METINMLNQSNSLALNKKKLKKIGDQSQTRPQGFNTRIIYDTKDIVESAAKKIKEVALQTRHENAFSMRFKKKKKSSVFFGPIDRISTKLIKNFWKSASSIENSILLKVRKILHGMDGRIVIRLKKIKKETARKPLPAKKRSKRKGSSVPFPGYSKLSMSTVLKRIPAMDPKERKVAFQYECSREKPRAAVIQALKEESM